MALRGKKPEAVEKRLKALFFGEAGVGKTTAAIGFPRPYVVDTERGAENEQYAKTITDRGGALFQTNDFDEMVAEVRNLIAEKHPYVTLVIDPITPVYDDLIEKAERTVGTEFGKHYGEAKKQWKRLANLLIRLDMNVIVTSHQKNLYVPGGKMELAGKTFDGPKGLDHLFDLVFEVNKRGKDRVGIVRKTRVTGFPDGETIPFSYDQIADRYGRDVLERDAIVEELATPEMAKEATELVVASGINMDIVEAWFEKARASKWIEMPKAATAKCIDYLKKQIDAKEAKAA